MKPLVTIREALVDPHLLGEAIPGDSWRLWRILLIAAMGEPLTDDERPLFVSVTGRSREPLERVDEFWGICGRRSGKTRAAGVLGAYIAGLCDWNDYLAPGERGELPIMARNTRQAAKAFSHVLGVLSHSPDLSGQIESHTSDTIRLLNGIDVIVTPADFRSGRGGTSIAAVGDEVAFWDNEDARNPDTEILNAVRPSLLTTQGPLIVISSPYGRRGELFKAWKRHYGEDGDPLILVVKGPSQTFNPTLPDKDIARAFSDDPSRASAEYGAEFRADVETLLAREIVENAVDVGITERIRRPDMRYVAFVDAAGGSGQDSMTLAIAHRDGDKGILDLTREKTPPFNPEQTVAEFAGVLKSFGIGHVTGDRFGAGFVQEAFRRHGIEYRPSKLNRSEIYVGIIAAFNSNRVSLLSDDRLVLQFIALERRTTRGGLDRVDHPTGQHDDLANAAAGALNLALNHTAPAAAFGTYGTPDFSNARQRSNLSGNYSYA